MKKSSLYSLILIALLGACKPVPNNEHEHDHISAREVLDANNIRVGELKKHAVVQSISIAAQIEAPPQSTAQVYPIISAYVREVYVIKGQKVKKGERLARLYHPDILSLQERYLSAKISLERNEKDYIRKQQLIESQAISEKDLQASTATYFSSKSEVRSLESTLRSMGVKPEKIKEDQLEENVYLLAPIPGNILDTRAGIGQFAGNSAPLFTIVNDDHLHLELQVPPTYIDQIQPGNPVEFRTRTRTEVLHGDVYLVNAVAEESGFFNVHAHFHDNQGLLHPGTYAEARIIYASDTLFALPKNAVWYQDGHAYAVLVENDKFIKVSVATGMSSDDYIAIVDHEKLKGKQLVLNGVKYLLSEVEAGHSH